MAAAGSRFSGSVSLFLVATILMIASQTGPCQCQHRYLPEIDYSAQPDESSARLERDIIEDGLGLMDGLVGAPPRRGRQRNSRQNSGKPTVSLLTSCPDKASEESISAFQRRLIFFHRPGDTARTELRFEEMVGAKKQRMWNTSTIDLMISDYDFDLSKPTLMYTLGLEQATTETYLKVVRQNYDKLQANRARPSYNLLLFDWGSFSYGGYGDCVAETPRTAKLLAEFFEYLHTRHNYDLGKLHLISFSLSTHIAGQTGRILAKRQRIGQITYLDPTGVCFHDTHAHQTFGERYGARDDDATLTVAKHYNKFGFGSYRDHVGRVNIQVNDGTNQKRAPSTRGMLTNIIRSIFPSHMYAVHHNVLLFAPQDDCHDMAYECASYQDFLKGQCGSCGKSNETCMLMNTVGNLELGIELAKINFKQDSRMFTLTGETQFCAYQYQVVLTLKKSPSPEVTKRLVSGEFSFEPVKGFLVQPTHQRGKQFTQLLTPSKRITTFATNIDMSSQQKLVKLIDSVRIRYLSHYSPVVRHKWSIKYCPDSSGKALIKCKG